jgi:hypothetical protein
VMCEFCVLKQPKSFSKPSVKMNVRCSMKCANEREDRLPST